MPQEKPPCSDFIIATIRRLRQKHPNYSPQTAGGAALYRVHSVAIEIYTQEEFREGLTIALENDTVVMIVPEIVDGNWTCKGRKNKILPPLLSSSREWCLNQKGEYFKPNRSKHYTGNTMLYVRADGLPYKVHEAEGAAPKKHSLAQSIIQSMNKTE